VPTVDDTAARRLRDEEVRERLSRLEELLALVEQAPGPSGELALSAVTELSQVYGEALARAVSYALESTAPLEAFVRDELIGHLMVLHGIHPQPVRERIAHVVDELRPAVAERGGEIAFGGVEENVATVTLTMSGCGSSAQGLTQAVREAVLAVAPELAQVTITPQKARTAAFIPLGALADNRVPS
jgi:Fe-S cluster biogenesis protein NfuA